MASRHHGLDPHAKPPDAIKELYKKCQKLKIDDIATSPLILDMSRDGFALDPNITKMGEFNEEIDSIFSCYDSNFESATMKPIYPIPIYSHSKMPGLRIVPSLIPPSTQKSLLRNLIHRDLSNPNHKSNVHLHHKIKYPENGLSFFSIPRTDNFTFEPKNSSVHKPISISQFMNKRLRWITLGGQYDWTNKVYPDGPPPAFPQGTAQLLHGLFPDLHPHAAIVNFYSPGDTLSLHRDVAEECDRGLLSISIGCDGIFILGLEGESETGEIEVKTLAIRLRSGDAVYMDGTSRFAWHGVPQIVPNTCPTWLRNWPTNDGVEWESTNFEDWEGWMGNKRINLNVRQMWD